MNLDELYDLPDGSLTREEVRKMIDVLRAAEDVIKSAKESLDITYTMDFTTGWPPRPRTELIQALSHYDLVVGKVNAS